MSHSLFARLHKNYATDQIIIHSMENSLLKYAVSYVYDYKKDT